MNSLVFDDMSTEQLALETAKCLKNICTNSKKVTCLHKELLEINVIVLASIEESKKRLREDRLELAHQASSFQEVVTLLTQNCKKIMSPVPPHQRNVRSNKHLEDNNNIHSKFTQQLQARTFITWYKRMVDHERQTLPLYFADDIILKWFGRTIKTKKKVSSFIKYDMQSSRHDFTSIESIDKMETRNENVERKHNSRSESPQHSSDLNKTNRPDKRKLPRSNCHSPEWAAGCGPEIEVVDKKRSKHEKIDYNNVGHQIESGLKRQERDDVNKEISCDGDGIGQQIKRKCVLITPPNKEMGQGDCYPSTSGADSNKSYDTLNAQLPKLDVECNGYIEFTRSKNNRNIDTMKWERKCKMQITYSIDPLNVDEYIIWMLRYFDENKCRRNLLSAFEEITGDDG